MAHYSIQAVPFQTIAIVRSLPSHSNPFHSIQFHAMPCLGVPCMSFRSVPCHLRFITLLKLQGGGGGTPPLSGMSRHASSRVIGIGAGMSGKDDPQAASCSSFRDSGGVGGGGGGGGGCGEMGFSKVLGGCLTVY